MGDLFGEAYEEVAGKMRCGEQTGEVVPPYDWQTDFSPILQISREQIVPSANDIIISKQYPRDVAASGELAQPMRAADTEDHTIAGCSLMRAACLFWDIYEIQG